VQLQRWLRAQPSRADLSLGLALVAVQITGVVTAGSTQPGSRPMDALGFALAVAVTAPIVLRRRHPAAMVTVGALAQAGLWIGNYPNFCDTLAVSILVYTAAEAASRRAQRCGITAVVGLTALTAVGVLTAEVPLVILPLVGLVGGAAWALGNNSRLRRAHVETLELNASLAEQRRREEAVHAVEQERARIARELHDVVAHAMSVMVVQAGAGRRVLDSNPAGARESFELIETVGRDSLGEMRRLLGVLRSDAGRPEAAGASGLEPAPTLAQLDHLIERSRDGGVPTELQVVGAPFPLGAGLELHVYRIVQEALTNVRKHAGPGAEAHVCLDYGADGLGVSVLDNGRGAAASRADGPAHGLVGMAERVEMSDGILRTGPRPDGGFEVVAALPYRHTSPVAP